MINKFSIFKISLRKSAHLLCLSTALMSFHAFGETLHEEKSLYRDIIVDQNGSRRCLIFNVFRGDRNQTCMDMNNRDALVFTYTRMSFAGLLLKPDPQRILIAGLGGGSIPTTFNKLYPDAKIDIVEIDQAVVNVAKDYFFFEENENMKVSVNDARVFIKRAGLSDRKYDYIILDAFGGDYIPEHLLTREFLEEVKQIMSPDAVLIANTFSTSRFYDHESVTYQRVFSEFFNFKLPTSGNRIIIAQLKPLPPRGRLVTEAQRIAPSLERFDVPILEYPSRLSTRVDWDMSRRVLTDQYSPANLLKEGR
ncbi:MAG: spermidine synthase [SAR86 cluster bacterium]|uniref:Spermidine synthase n=1 Tax=SAR86 cluster bacterium TaxID=2030880 RepID=A0A2A5B442_9GAMM|nr:MAG: spermidine synthase [SAR86 cluster bacterium]